MEGITNVVIFQWVQMGVGELPTNGLLIYDGLNMKFMEFRAKKDPYCEHCAQINNGQDKK